MVQEFQIGGTSARVAKFVIQRGTLGYELRKPKGTSNSMILVPLFDLKFLRRTRGTWCRNFKSAALVSEVTSFGGIDDFRAATSRPARSAGGWHHGRRDAYGAARPRVNSV